MLYYVGKGSFLEKGACKEYKTLRGAMSAAQKDAELMVWDEDGNCVGNEAGDTPEGDTQEAVPGGDEAAAEGDPGDAAGEATEGGTEEAAADPQELTEEPLKGDELFWVKTTVDMLYIRTGPSTFSQVIGVIRESRGEKKKHPIKDARYGWGKLAEDPYGWIKLSFTKAVRKG